jgi:hypothetical protein
LPLTGTVEVNAAPAAHVASFGPNTVKTTEPVGLAPPEITAVSEIAPPTATAPDAVVAITGAAGPDAETTTDSPAELHGDVAAEFPASPEYAATNR